MYANISTKKYNKIVFPLGNQLFCGIFAIERDFLFVYKELSLRCANE